MTLIAVDTLVIGGGLVGSAAAKYASQAGETVTLLDSGNFGFGSSRGNSRIVRSTTQASEEHLSGFFSRAAKNSIDTWQNLDLVTFTGCMYLAKDDKVLQNTATSITQASANELSEKDERYSYLKGTKMDNMKFEKSEGKTSGTINPTEIVAYNISEAQRNKNFKAHDKIKVSSIKPTMNNKKFIVTTVGEDGAEVSYVTDKLVLAPGAWSLTGAVRDFLENKCGYDGEKIIQNVKVMPAFLHFFEIDKGKEKLFEHFPATIFKSKGMHDKNGVEIPNGYIMKDVGSDGKQYIKIAFYSPFEARSMQDIEDMRMQGNGSIALMSRPDEKVKIEKNKAEVVDFLNEFFPGMANNLKAGPELKASHTVACPITFTKDLAPLFGNVGKGNNCMMYVDSDGVSAKQSDYIGSQLANNMREISDEEKKLMKPDRTITRDLLEGQFVEPKASKLGNETPKALGV